MTIESMRNEDATFFEAGVSKLTQEICMKKLNILEEDLTAEDINQAIDQAISIMKIVCYHLQGEREAKLEKAKQRLNRQNNHIGSIDTAF